MIRIAGFCMVLFGLFASCNKDELKATVPAYLHIDSIRVATNFNSEGTASDRITTVWVLVDGQVQGAYELPCEFPIIETGERTIEILAGMNLNGIAAYRTVYPFYGSYSEKMTLEPEKIHYLNASTDSIPVVNYDFTNSLRVLEDFENIGLSFQETASSDTVMFKTNDTSEVFRFMNEPIGGSGKIVMEPGMKFETKSITAYDLPTFGADVYVEVNYKGDIPFTIGIFANEATQIIQAPVVTVNPSNEWNKIYINLVTEVSAYPNARDYNIFIGSLNTSNSNKTLYLDNIKLIH